VSGWDARHARHGDVYKGAANAVDRATRDYIGAPAPPPRRDLRESLEAYAARLGVDVHVARPFWRCEGLRLLNVSDASLTDYPGLCAIAPGVAVPTAFAGLVIAVFTASLSAQLCGSTISIARRASQ